MKLRLLPYLLSLVIILFALALQPVATTSAARRPSDTPTLAGPSPTRTASLTPSITPTATISRTPTVSLTPSLTPTATISRTPTVSLTPSITSTPTKSRTPTLSLTPSITSTPTISRTPTLSLTPSKTGSPTLTLTPSRTVSPTITRTPSKTVSPTITRTPTSTPTPVSPCSTSSPPSGAYTVTLCFTTPAYGATITGNVPVNVSVAVTGTNPGVQRMVFYLNGTYLLTDYQSAYSFTLPTTKWKDGVYTLQVEALLRDGYTTAPQASMPVTFKNGITKTPKNTLTFTPVTGSNPPAGAPFIVAASGDGASGEAASSNVANLLASMNPNLFLYLGDVYENGSVAEFYNWYGTGAVNFGAFRSITDPTVGNHEYTAGAAPGYFDFWNNIPNYYSYTSHGWHFISLNSNASSVAVDKTSAQYKWLSSDLTTNTKLCTIVYYHHPLFNIGPEGPTTAMSDIWALMAQKGVTLVINGHDHDYQRWVPLNASGQPSSTGITEFVAGGAGHGLQTIANTDSRVAYSNDTNPTAFGVLKLALTSSGASFSYVNYAGAILDSGVVPCLKAGTDTQAPSVPGGLTATAASNATQVDLGWSASTDTTGVAGYTIYRNGTSLTTVPGTTLAYSDTTALPATAYSYTVDAFDPAGNHSAKSTPANVTTPAMPSSLPFPVLADTYVNSVSPDSNFGSGTVFRLLGSPNDLHAFLRFSVHGLAGFPVAHAYLMVYPNTNAPLGISAVGVSDNSWDENTVTYNTAPPLGSLIGSSGPITAGTWVSIDVTPYITGEGTYSFGLTTTGTSTLSFAALEGGINTAQLIINPAIPDPTAPSIPGGLTATAASNATQVDLAWSASTDNNAVTGYTIYRNGSSLTTVSGTTLTYSDLTALPNTTYSYTVDAFDAAGNHSAKSTPASATTPAMPSSLTFPVLADTYVNSASPTANFGADTVFRLLGSPNDLHAFLRFSVHGLAGFPVAHAHLLVFTNNNASLGISALGVPDNSWDENAVTYASAPSLGALIASSGPLTAGTWVSIDVTPYITGEGTFSFGLTTPSTSTLSFAALEGGINAAQLIVEPAIPDHAAPSVPAGLAATAASNATQVDLAWSASTDNNSVSGYTIYRDGASLTTVSGTTLTYSDMTAAPNTTYSYTVDAFDAAGNHSAPSDPASATTPAMPSSLTFPVLADTYVNSGSPASNFGSDTVFRLLGSPNDLHAFLRFSVHGLAGFPIAHAYLLVYPNTNASLGISALGVADNSWDENAVTFTTAPSLGALIASSGPITAGTVVSIDVTPYITGEGTFSLGLTTTSASTLSFASREGGSNAAQLIINPAIPDHTAPSVPAGLTATAASNATQVDLAWSASTDNNGVSGYTIYRDGNLLTSVSGTTLTYSDLTAAPNTTYSYSVDAFDAASNRSAQSDPASVTTPAMPASLTFNVQADTYVNSGSPAANFGSATVFRLLGSPTDLHAFLRFKVQGLAGYPIAHAYLMVFPNNNASLGISALGVSDNSWDENAVTYTTAPPLGSLIASSGPVTAGTMVSIEVTPYITGDGTYSFGLTTPGTSTLSFAAREGGSNAAQLVIVPDNAAPSIPAGLTATAASNATEVDLSWSASTDNTGVAGYTIYRDGSSLTTVSGTTLTYSDLTALPGTTYSYSVDAFDAAGNRSAKSDPASATTPAMPSSLTFPVLADTYVNSGLPTSNFGSATVFRLLGTPTDLHALLRFKVQGLLGYPIAHAYLMVFPNNNAPLGISALRVTDITWVENSVTYATAPSLGALIASSGPVTAGTMVSIDVTPYITGEGTYSFGLTTASASTLSFAAREGGTNAAQLVIVPDNQAPSIPGGLTATAASNATQVDLAWAASTDNTGVTGYTIYRNGTSLTTVSGATLAYSDITALPNTTYSYTVDAVDAAGNRSAQSDPASATTPAMPASLTFPVQADTYVNSASPTSNFGTATVFRLLGTPNDLHAFLRFSVHGLAGFPIAHAYLKVFPNTNAPLGISALRVADNSWVETGVTYNTAPPLGSLIASSGPITSATMVSIEVTPYITGEGTFSFGLTTTGASTLSFVSREGGSNAAQLVIIPDNQAPSIPGGLTATTNNGVQVNLAWSASTDNTGVAGYTIYRDGSTLNSVSGTTLAFSDTTALPNTTYSYSVDAFDSAGNHSARSAPVISDNQPPGIPGGLTATTYNGAQVDLAWSASTDDVGVTGYTIYRNGASLNSVSGTTLAYSDTSALPGTTYTYTMDAFDAAGNHSAASNPAVSDNQAPGVPTGLTATTNDGAQVDLAWSAATDDVGVTGYTIYRDGSLLNSVSGATLAYSDTSAVPGTTYSYTVDAFDAAGNHSARSDPAVSDNQAPGIPGGLTATTYNGAQVDLAWSAATDDVGVTGYTIYRDGSLLNSVSGTTLAYSDTTAVPGTTYSYTVDAFDAAGNHSAASNPAVSDNQAPGIPGGLTATASSSTQVDLSWSAATDDIGVAGYTIYRDGILLTSVSGATLTYSDPSAQTATTYSYTVDAFDAAGNHSAQSDPASATTP